MIPAVIESGIIIYEIIQVLVAFIAVILSVKWKKTEFLPGLAFLFIYTVLDIIDTIFFMIMQGEYVDIAQFGFILLAIVFFIIGMHPSWSHMMRPDQNKVENEDKPKDTSSILSHLRKL